MSTSLRDHARAPFAVGSPWIGWSTAAAVAKKNISMTFYEAALQILQREGKPLHANEITELAVRDDLLSHVGKQPELTMASRLAAMARRSQDRRLVAVEPDVFGLTDWDVAASAAALDQSGLPESHDEEEPPLRGRERHPRLDKENVRVAGRSDRRRKYEEADRRKKKRKKRVLPLPELVHEILDSCGRPVPAFELAAAIREHDLLPDDLGREALEKALREENTRRVEEDRDEAFAFYDGGLIGLHGGPTHEDDGADLEALVAAAVAKIAGERKPAEVQPVAAPAREVAPAAAGTADLWLAEQRMTAIRQLRQGLLQLDGPSLENLSENLLDALGYRDVRIAKRHKDGSLFTCRRRMGLTEVRFAVRVIRGGKDVRREDVVELRRDMASHSAQIGVILSPSDATREGRNEVGQPGQPLVTLLCADALAEQMAERGFGVSTRTVTLVQFDETSLRRMVGQVAQAAPAASEGKAEAKAGAPKSGAAERRERREKDRREWRERREKEREERRKLRLAAAEGAEAAGPASEAEAGTAAAPVAEQGEAEGRKALDGSLPAAAEVPVSETAPATVEGQRESSSEAPQASAAQTHTPAVPVSPEAPESAVLPIDELAGSTGAGEGQQAGAETSVADQMAQPLGAESPILEPSDQPLGAETPILEPADRTPGAESPILETSRRDGEQAEAGIAMAGAAASLPLEDEESEGDGAEEDEKEPNAAGGSGRRPRRRRRSRSSAESAASAEAGEESPAVEAEAAAGPEGPQGSDTTSDSQRLPTDVEG